MRAASGTALAANPRLQVISPHALLRTHHHRPTRWRSLGVIKPNCHPPPGLPTPLLPLLPIAPHDRLTISVAAGGLPLARSLTYRWFPARRTRTARVPGSSAGELTSASGLRPAQARPASRLQRRPERSIKLPTRSMPTADIVLARYVAIPDSRLAVTVWLSGLRGCSTQWEKAVRSCLDRKRVEGRLSRLLQSKLRGGKRHVGWRPGSSVHLTFLCTELQTSLLSGTTTETPQRWGKRNKVLPALAAMVKKGWSFWVESLE